MPTPAPRTRSVAILGLCLAVSMILWLSQAGSLHAQTDQLLLQAPNPATSQASDPATMPAAQEPVTATPISAPAPTPTPTLTAASLTVMPTRVGDDRTLLLQPGEKRQVTLMVHNGSEQPVTIISRPVDYLVGEDGITPQPIELPPEENRWSLANWMTVVPNQQTIAAGQTKTIEALIEVPADAFPGGRYAMVDHQIAPSPVDDSTSPKTAAVNQIASTLFYLIVDGPVRENAFIRQLSVPNFQEFGPVPYSFIIDNDSDIHVKPATSVNIYNIWGKRVSSEAVETANVFPRAQRAFEGKWERIWGFGRYRAEVASTYGSQGQMITESMYFWLVPVRLIAAIGVGLLAAIGLIVSIRRHLLAKSEAQARRVKELEAQLQELEHDKPDAL